MYLPNKYTTWYNNIIAESRKRVNHIGYTEKHHIIPKSLGGSDDPSNLVRLTAREHFICHRLLVKMTGGSNRRKMANAARGMAVLRNPSQQDRYKVTSRVYEQLKRAVTQSPESNKKRSEKLKGIKRPPRTAEHSAKLSFPKSEETKKKLSEARIGKTWGYKHTDETKAKMSASSKGRFQGSQMCEHCGKEISIGNYKRWHGANCKKQ